MPASEADRIHALADFADFLGGLAEEGCETAVIGGIAVGAYGRLMGETVLSHDLDVLADFANMERILRWCVTQGAVVRKRPQARSVPTAFIDWHGKEINVLLNSVGLPAPDVTLQRARGFLLPERPDLPVLVADPYDLLTNKLKVNRPKDLPHIDVLLRFIEEEIVETFRTATDPRERLGPARRLLKATGARTLPAGLAARLVPLAMTPVDVRFLMQSVPTSELADRVEACASKWPEAALEVAEIRRHRRFPRG